MTADDSPSTSCKVEDQSTVIITYGVNDNVFIACWLLYVTMHALGTKVELFTVVHYCTGRCSKVDASKLQCEE